MKKLLVGTILAVIALAGCDAKEDKTSVDSDKTYVFEMGITPGTQSNEYKATQFLAEKLSEKSDGKIELKIFPDAQLGDDRAMLDQCSAGELDITLGETGRLGLWVKEAEIFQLPYVFDDFNDLKTTLFDTEEGKGLVKKFEDEKGWIFVDTAYNGTRQTTSNHAINSIEDMKNMKLRVPNAQANLEFAQNIGASPTPMAFSEVYLALQTNAVNGQENPLSAIKSSKFYEVQTHIALTNHILNDQGYIISKQTYDELPEDIQKILVEAIKETTEYHTQLFIDDESALIDFFKENGVTITEPDMSLARKKMQPSYDRYLSESGEEGLKLYNAIIN